MFKKGKRYKNILNKKYVIFLFFLIFLILGINIYKDYGISIDEEFHRASGFYWLNNVLQNLPENERVPACVSSCPTGGWRDPMTAAHG